MAAVCLLAVAIGAGVVAVQQRGNAQGAQRGAEISSLSNQPLSMRSSRRDVAALLSVEAPRLRADVDSMSARLGTFTNDPGSLGYHRSRAPGSRARSSRTRTRPWSRSPQAIPPSQTLR